MKKNTPFVATIISVSLLHIVGIVALSNFATKPAQLVPPQEELTFVELGGEAAAAAPTPTQFEPPKPDVAKPDIKRTVVKKPQTDSIVERKPDPKPEKRPVTKPDTSTQQTQSTSRNDKAQNNSRQGQSAQSQSNQGQGSGQSEQGKGNNNGKGQQGNQAGSGGDVVGPSFRAGSQDCRRAQYPDAARENGDQGVVVIRMMVGTDGRVANAQVAKSSGSNSLNNAALKRAKTCVFTPATKGGVPIAHAYTQSYSFKIN